MVFLNKEKFEVYELFKIGFFINCFYLKTFRFENYMKNTNENIEFFYKDLHIINSNKYYGNSFSSDYFKDFFKKYIDDSINYSLEEKFKFLRYCKDLQFFFNYLRDYNEFFLLNYKNSEIKKIIESCNDREKFIEIYNKKIKDINIDINNLIGEKKNGIKEIYDEIIDFIKKRFEKSKKQIKDTALLDFNISKEKIIKTYINFFEDMLNDNLKLIDETNSFVNKKVNNKIATMKGNSETYEQQIKIIQSYKDIKLNMEGNQLGLIKGIYSLNNEILNLKIKIDSIIINRENVIYEKSLIFDLFLPFNISEINEKQDEIDSKNNNNFKLMIILIDFLIKGKNLTKKVNSIIVKEDNLKSYIIEYINEKQKSDYLIEQLPEFFSFLDKNEILEKTENKELEIYRLEEIIENLREKL